MSVIEAMWAASNILVNPIMMGWLFVGTFVGLVFGALPGLGAITGCVLFLPFTFGMDPKAAMLLFAGIISVAPLGGALPAILLNTPGTAPAAASCFDGFPLAQKGEGARAIGIACMSCFVGTLFGVVVLCILLQIIIPVILAFRAPELFWITLFGITVVSFVVKEDFLKGLASAGLGILLSLVGLSDVFGKSRFDGGILYLWDGVPMVPFYIGLFALSELISYTSRGGTIASPEKTAVGLHQIWKGCMDVLRHPLLVTVSATIGTIVGIIPGIGGAVANFVSYTVAKRISKHPEAFGKGSIEGVIASEVAGDAKEGGSLLPTAAFGIPGSADMVLVLGAFIIHGFEPGPLLLRDHLDVVMTLNLGFVYSQILGSVFVFFIANYICRLVTVKSKYLAPFVLVLCLIGSYSIRFNIWDVLIAVGSGFFGYLLKRFGYPYVPIAIGYILGNLVEKYFHQSLMMSYGSYTVFLSSPICLVTVVLIMLLIGSAFCGKKLPLRAEEEEPL